MPDVLRHDLSVVFCGSAAGAASARAGAYYAGKGNLFWPILHKSDFTPRRLAPSEFELLPDYGIGLTDLAKHSSGSDADLPADAYDPEALKRKIMCFRPDILAFNGKRSACAYFARRQVDYGPQADTVGQTLTYVLPSTAGLARRYWDEDWWRRLAALGRERRHHGEYCSDQEPT